MVKSSSSASETAPLTKPDVSRHLAREDFQEQPQAGRPRQRSPGGATIECDACPAILDVDRHLTQPRASVSPAWQTGRPCWPPCRHPRASPAASAARGAACVDAKRTSARLRDSWRYAQLGRCERRRRPILDRPMGFWVHRRGPPTTIDQRIKSRATPRAGRTSREHSCCAISALVVYTAATSILSPTVGSPSGEARSERCEGEERGVCFPRKVGTKATGPHAMSLPKRGAAPYEGSSIRDGIGTALAFCGGSRPMPSAQGFSPTRWPNFFANAASERPAAWLGRPFCLPEAAFRHGTWHHVVAVNRPATSASTPWTSALFANATSPSSRSRPRRRSDRNSSAALTSRRASLSTMP